MSPKHLKMHLKIFPLVFILLLAADSFTQDNRATAVNDSTRILPEKERAGVMNEWLRWRLDNIIPELMRREGIDMWLIINREYNEDPVYMTLVPEPTMAARRTSILIFYDRGEGREVERLSGSYYGIGGWYKSTWLDKKKKQFESLAEVIKKLNPRKVGINVSSTWAFGDGLTASLKEKLEKALGPEFSSRLVSAENLCVGWLETRSPEELSVYRYVCGIAHDIIAEFYSNKVITPDITTTEDVVWWIRQKITGLGLEAWFQPSISIQRHKKEAAKYENDRDVIRRGDLLHCDVGIKYLGLCTDMQWQAYVCKIGEKDAPEGLKEALRRTNKLGDIFRNEFKTGRSGNEIVWSAMKKAEAEGLRPLIYSHPVGSHGHAAGPPMDARPPEQAPEGVELRGKYPLYPNTVYAIEYSCTTSIPEWDNQDVRIGFEETAMFTEEGCQFIDGHQTRFYLIK
ncbi:MAG: aminopeptidase P family protein [Candidatus Aminicenantes bacterium]|nr:aminopeptidase P family protein [Candidatus Aminicenantes bacterium]MDH5466476.1 aminopeptidase P family protein [Candidatus Aminicenantes bacterium]MDH5705533.1 aminopeptidase P family protein [Candidatus Aminicenantes bacterium]